MSRASGTVQVLASLALVVVLIGAAVYFDRSASPNLGTVMMFLGLAVTGLLNLLKTSQVQQQTNGNLARTTEIKDAALGALPPHQAADVLRRVDNPPDTPRDTTP